MYLYRIKPCALETYYAVVTTNQIFEEQGVLCQALAHTEPKLKPSVRPCEGAIVHLSDMCSYRDISH